MEHFWPNFQNELQAAAAEVKLFDITRGLAQRIEGQFRRHWSLIPALWNLYFREQINTNISLKSSSKGEAGGPAPTPEQDAALAAAALYEFLTKGTYRDQQGKRCKVDGNIMKLPYAEGLTHKQQHLLRDFRFRTKSVPGTMEVRTKIGHIGFWASIIYGQSGWRFRKD